MMMRSLYLVNRHRKAITMNLKATAIIGLLGFACSACGNDSPSAPSPPQPTTLNFSPTVEGDGYALQNVTVQFRDR